MSCRSSATTSCNLGSVHREKTLMMTDTKEAEQSKEILTENSRDSSGGSTSCGGTNKRLKTGCSKNSGTAKEKKDKIGERLTALQQLVSPFGKTDTATVLSEATGYIKFLHEQLQVLSIPYLRAATMEGQVKEEEEEYYSLRSRGLCLVPVSSTHSIAHSNGADLWAPSKISRNPWTKPSNTQI